MKSCFGEVCARCKDMENGTGGMRQASGHTSAQHVTLTYSAGGGEPLKGVGREFSLERSLGLLIENGLSCEDCKQGDYFPKS